MKYLYLIFSIAIIAAISWLSLQYWHDRYPLFLEFYDIAYHASAAVGLERAGGFTIANFWSGYSSFTSPHFYFPFFHITELLLLYIGAGQFFLTYWLSWMLLPLSFLTVLLFTYNVYGSRIAVYTTALLSLSPIWLDKQFGLSPQALVYVLTPLVFLALAKEKYVTATALTLCSMLTHFTGVLLAPFLLLYGLQNRLQRRPVFIMLAALLLLGSPVIWLGMERIKSIHLFIAWSKSGFLNSVKASLYRLFDVRQGIHVYLGWLGAIGLIISYWKKNRFLILPSYFLCFFPLAWTTQDIRFWGGPCLFILPLLGGVALGSAQEGMDSYILRATMKAYHGSPSTSLGVNSVEKLLQGFSTGLACIVELAARTVLSIMFFIFALIGANLIFSKISNEPAFVKTPTLVYLKSPELWQRPRLTFDMEDRWKIVRLAEKNVKDDEFFWINSSYNVNNFVALNSRRSTISSNKPGILPEEGIRLVVDKVSPGSGYTFLERINNEFNAYILNEPANVVKVKIPKPLIKTRDLSLIFLGMGALILADLLWPRHSLKH